MFISNALHIFFTIGFARVLCRRHFTTTVALHYKFLSEVVVAVTHELFRTPARYFAPHFASKGISEQPIQDLKVNHQVRSCSVCGGGRYDASPASVKTAVFCAVADVDSGLSGMTCSRELTWAMSLLVIA